MKGAVLLLSMTLTLPAAAVPVPPGAPLTVREIVALLKAGIGETVILRQVEATGTRLVLRVPEMLDLKAAGAGDALLEALIRAVRPPTAGVIDRGFRIYREVNDRGEEVLHVTNLDASGRRIGGEIEAEERAIPDLPARTPQAPVIVNIYPPAEPGEPIAGADDRSQSIRFRGWYPGLLPAWPRVIRPHPAAGSREEFFGRPRIINTAPYRSATAAQRNRRSFRRD